MLPPTSTVLSLVKAPQQRQRPLRPEETVHQLADRPAPNFITGQYKCSTGKNFTLLQEALNNTEENMSAAICMPGPDPTLQV